MKYFIVNYKVPGQTLFEYSIYFVHTLDAAKRELLELIPEAIITGGGPITEKHANELMGVG